MKITPVSADLLIKLALAAAAVGAVYLIWRKASTVAGDVLQSAGEVADQVITGLNPADSGNVVNRAVAAVGGSLVSDPAGPGKNADGSWSLGGWIYDVTHPGTVAAITDMTATTGHTAYWKS